MIDIVKMCANIFVASIMVGGTAIVTLVLLVKFAMWFVAFVQP